MKRLRKPVFALISGLLLLIAGCAPPVVSAPSDVNRTLVLSVTSSRTILPALPVGSTYTVTIDQPGQSTKVVTLSDLSTPITNLVSGPATISVEVRDSAGTLLAKADPQSVNVGQSPQPDVGIILTPVSTGQGDVQLTISWPLNHLTSIHAYLYPVPVGGSPVSVASWMTPPSPFTTTSSQVMTASAVSSGTYLLKIDLQGGATSSTYNTFPSYTRVVQIWPGLSTTAAVALTVADLTEIPAAPSNIQFSQTGTVVTMSWSDNSDTEEGFRIYDNAGVLLANTGPGVNLVNVVSKDLMIHWSVSAWNAIGESTHSVTTPHLYHVADTVSVPGATWVPIGGVLPAAYPQSLPVHSVASLRAFDIGRTEVTYRQWNAVVQWATSLGVPYVFSHAGTNSGGTVNFPVVSISWRDAMLWCNALSEAEGLTPVYYSDPGFTTPFRSTNLSAFDGTAGSQDNPFILKSADGYRLPTEAEWEAAARYVAPGVWNDSDRASGAASNALAAAHSYGWFWPDTMHEVGATLPNPLGMYDMSGNALEWIQDWYHGDYNSGDDYTSPGTTGPTAFAPWNARVGRGSSIAHDLSSNPENAGVSWRGAYDPSLPQVDLGFRVARGIMTTQVSTTVVTSPVTTFVNPSYLAFGTAGRVLVIDEQGGGTVTGFDSAGTVFESFPAPVTAHGLAFVGGAAYTGLTTTIHQFVGPWPSPSVGSVFGASPTDTTALNVSITSLGAVTRGPGPDDTLLIIDQATGNLRLLNLPNDTVTTLVPETVNAPQGLLYDPVKDRIYLADTGNARVRVYTAAGTLIKTFNGTGISGPIGLTVDPTGNTLYVANSGTNTITLVDTNSPGPGTKALFPAATGLNNPHGLLLAPDGSLYIADTGNHRVVRVSP